VQSKNATTRRKSERCLRVQASKSTFSDAIDVAGEEGRLLASDEPQYAQWHAEFRDQR
jgi:hypothetical protein